MKIHFLTDLHTEFNPYSLATQDFDVLILGGDIGTKMNGLHFIRSLGINDKPILYICGNHEYYGTALPHLTNKIRKATEGTNIHYLENDEFIHDGVRFLGCTMWTDYTLQGNPILSQMVAQMKMSDYKYIRVSPAFRRVMPGDLSKENRSSIRWLSSKLAEPFNGKTVVLTHHAPSIRSLEHNDELAPCYASNLEHLMVPSVNLWLHGHTHFPVDYVVNETRVLSNPRGYAENGVTGFRNQLIVEM